jgi:hypothetical protein
MRKLQYLFMALAALCFAVPAFADGGSAPINLVPIGAGIGMALASGQGNRISHRGTGAQSGRACGHPVAAGSGPGLHRVPHPIHAGYHLRQGKVRLVQTKIERPRPCGWGCFIWYSLRLTGLLTILLTHISLAQVQNFGLGLRLLCHVQTVGIRAKSLQQCPESSEITSHSSHETSAR